MAGAQTRPRIVAAECGSRGSGSSAWTHSRGEISPSSPAQIIGKVFWYFDAGALDIGGMGGVCRAGGNGILFQEIIARMPVSSVRLHLVHHRFDPRKQS